MKKEENSNIEENIEEPQEVKKEETQEVKQEKKDEKKIVEELKTKLKEEKEKSDEYYEHLKRNMAEFDNFKKRMAKEKDMMYNTASASVISELLPVLDNFEKALQSESSDTSFKDGISMIYTQLQETLSKLGVEEIEALNKTFDPNFHEAVMHIDDEKFGEKEVIEVFRKGYKIGDKIIRHAMVKVAN